MAEYLHPGVYVEEIAQGPRPIEGVPTSTAAILGETERGPTEPTLVASYKEYLRWFGDAYAHDRYLPHAVNGFFENGGRRAFICRIVGRAATAAEAAFGKAFLVRAAGAGEWGRRVFVRIDDSTTRDANGDPIGFRIRLAYWSAAPGFQPADPFDPANGGQRPPQQVEDFDNLVTDESSPDFYGKRFPTIDRRRGAKKVGPNSSALGILIRKIGAPHGARPASGARLLADRGADDPAPPGTGDYDGLPAGKRKEAQGLAALELDPCREVALVHAPNVSNDIARKIVSHCELTRFCFAVLDCPAGMTASALDPRTSLADTQHAAFYFPWIVIADPKTHARKLVPPGGHVLGVYARTDAERGVFKAPANETVRGALDLEAEIDDRTQDMLNPRGVNVIRRFPGRGIRVWGARTLSSNSLWQYVSVRRLVSFLERSIHIGTQWAVFEPNDPKLWAAVTDAIRLFLRTQWRLGALLGRTEEEAFFVTCDERVMTQDDILNGRLVCEIGVAPVRPAEFIVLRIFQYTAGAQL